LANTPPIKLIVGLGNPGDKYAATRHNAGFWLVDALARQCNAGWRKNNDFHGELASITLNGQQCWLLKPQQFMNRSGLAVGALCNYYRLTSQEVLIVHDELDLPVGVARLKIGGGHGGHNGLRDLHRVLGEHYQRLRIGIAHPGDKHQVVDYVLKAPSKDDAIAIEQAIAQALAVMPLVLTGDFTNAMTKLHS
jgi:PTH1 family peptidyl-tRNA hydrolase